MQSLKSIVTIIIGAYNLCLPNNCYNNSTRIELILYGNEKNYGLIKMACDNYKYNNIDLHFCVYFVLYSITFHFGIFDEKHQLYYVFNKYRRNNTQNLDNCVTKYFNLLQNCLNLLPLTDKSTLYRYIKLTDNELQYFKINNIIDMSFASCCQDETTNISFSSGYYKKSVKLILLDVHGCDISKYSWNVYEKEIMLLTETKLKIINSNIMNGITIITAKLI